MSPQCQLPKTRQQWTTGVTGWDSKHIYTACLVFLPALWVFRLQSNNPAVIWCQTSVTATEQTTHQIFGTRSDSPRSSLLFSDSRYHSSTPFFSGCIQNIRCSGRCSSSGSPSPCSPPQPAGQSLRRKVSEMQKRQNQEALSSIHALPWRKSFWKTTCSNTRCWSVAHFGWRLNEQRSKDKSCIYFLYKIPE